jgi:xanthine dehydrogenase YagR molybdenum-binding subunit
MSASRPVSIGEPLDRVDGKAKTTGATKYSAEFAIPGLAHAKLVMSTAPSGRVSIDSAEAERAPGVIAVITPQTRCVCPRPSGD